MRLGVDGAELYYDVLGKGTPLLLMHGGPGLDHTGFRPWLDPLAERCRLVFFDQRGGGRSSRPASLAGVDHATWVADADALRRHLGCDRVLVLGHSYGGYLALEYALRHPDHTAGLALCSTAARSQPVDAILERAEGYARGERLETLRRALTWGIASDREYAGVFEQILPLYFRHPDPATLRRMVSATRFSAAALGHAFAECYPGYDVLGDLHRLTLPTLVLAGRHDWVFAPEDSAEPLHAALPRSRLRIFEDSGHYPFIEEHAAFLRTLGEWLEECT